MNSATYPLMLAQNDSAVSLRQVAVKNEIPTVRDLMEDGIYLLFLLKSGNFPANEVTFNERVDQFLATLDRVGSTFAKPSGHIIDAKYAFCALLDEIMLSPSSPLRERWQQNPLQLRLFGEHLAGEGFFSRLDRLRMDVMTNIEVIELFHVCILLGFQGKYVLEGRERLESLTARIGHEISSIRGRGVGMAPNWRLPFRITEYVGKVVPLWFYGAVVLASCLTAFLAFDWLLEQKLQEFPVARPMTTGAVTNLHTGF